MYLKPNKPKPTKNKITPFDILENVAKELALIVPVKKDTIKNKINKHKRLATKNRPAFCEYRSSDFDSISLSIISFKRYWFNL